jgi:hypothetical protein
MPVKREVGCVTGGAWSVDRVALEEQLERLTTQRIQFGVAFKGGAERVPCAAGADADGIVNQLLSRTRGLKGRRVVHGDQWAGRWSWETVVLTALISIFERKKIDQL